MEKIVFIEGMKCEGCSNRVKNLLEKIDGVKAEVSHEDKTAKLVMAAPVDDETIKNTVEKAGFTVTGMQ